MFTELAQDEEDAEDYDLEAMEHRTRARGDDDDDDDATLVGRRGPDTVADDEVVFEIGDEDGGSDDDDSPRAKRGQNGVPDHHAEPEEERAGLIGRRND